MSKNQTKTGKGVASRKTAAADQPRRASTGQRSGLVPEGDTRLTANIRTELHRKLKHAAIDRGHTVGELLEELIDKHL